MKDYNVSDYGVFSNAIATTKAYSEKVNQTQTSSKEAETVLSNQSVFMGPVADNCLQTFKTVDSDLSTLVSNMATLSGYLGETSANYKTGDTNASNTVTGIGDVSANSQASLTSGAMTSFNYRNQNFNVVNTKMSIQDYEAYLQKAKIYQNAGVLGGDCMLLSQYYAKDLLTGKPTSKNTVVNLGGSPATRLNERMKSTNVNDVLNYTYNELNQGHPVVLQVSQVRSDQGLRHLVTAVGYSSDVKGPQDMTPDKILVLDCVDGKIQTLGQSRETGGHARRLFAQGGNYQALGPTEKFLAKEVNNTPSFSA